jgi:hypothetical protein
MKPILLGTAAIAAAVAIGGVASFWLIERVVAFA